MKRPGSSSKSTQGMRTLLAGSDFSDHTYSGPDVFFLSTGYYYRA
jgi:sulfur relay (sulfurtransferase) DsrF/TusC family protein